MTNKELNFHIYQVEQYIEDERKDWENMDKPNAHIYVCFRAVLDTLKALTNNNNLYFEKD